MYTVGLRRWDISRISLPIENEKSGSRHSEMAHGAQKPSPNAND